MSISNKKQRINLSGIDISELDLSGLNISGLVLPEVVEMESQFCHLSHSGRLNLIETLSDEVPTKIPDEDAVYPEGATLPIQTPGMLNLVALLKRLPPDEGREIIQGLKLLDDRLHDQELIQEVMNNEKKEEELMLKARLSEIITFLKDQFSNVSHEDRLHLISVMGKVDRRIKKGVKLNEEGVRSQSLGSVVENQKNIFIEDSENLPEYLRTKELGELIEVFGVLSDKQRQNFIKNFIKIDYELENNSDKVSKNSDANNQTEKIENVQTGEVPLVPDSVIGKSGGKADIFGRLKVGHKVSGHSFEGIDYKPVNEDRLVFGENFVAVLDGMGGLGDGDKVSDLIGQYLLKYPEDSEKALQEVYEAINRTSDFEIRPGAGACMTICRFEKSEDGQKIGKIYQFGDTKLSVYRADYNNDAFETEDQSFVHFMVKSNQMTVDESLYHPRRNMVMNPLSKGDKFPKIIKSEVPIYTGDYVLMASDGLTDNFTYDEIGKLIKEAEGRYTKFEDLEKGVDKIAFIQRYLINAASKRMKNLDEIIDSTEDAGGREKMGIYTDGYLSKPKSDNLSVVLIEVAE